MPDKSTVEKLRIDDEYDVIDEDKTILDAAKLIKKTKLPDLVVITKEKKVLGVISDFDITTKVIAEGKDPATTKVTEAMYTVGPIELSTTVEQAFELLQKHQVPLVPVVESDQLVGVVTIQDVWSFIPE
ncbi:MAG: CBS domain-containing protein [Candidatus Hodarchaeales archaeon]|jgi:CBS domain-containing protein